MAGSFVRRPSTEIEGAVIEANRQVIIDPLTSMLFSTVAGADVLSQDACRHTLPVFDGHQRYDLKLAFKRMDKVTAEKAMQVLWRCAPCATNLLLATTPRPRWSDILQKAAKWRSLSHPFRARASWLRSGCRSRAFSQMSLSKRIGLKRLGSQ
jgi:hypothetical protein